VHRVIVLLKIRKGGRRLLTTWAHIILSTRPQLQQNSLLDNNSVSEQRISSIGVLAFPLPFISQTLSSFTNYDQYNCIWIMPVSSFIMIILFPVGVTCLCS
jgi:hypothetical protein